MENNTKDMLKSSKIQNAIKGRKGEAEAIAFLQKQGNILQKMLSLPFVY